MSTIPHRLCQSSHSMADSCFQEASGNSHLCAAHLQGYKQKPAFHQALKACDQVHVESADLIAALYNAQQESPDLVRFMIWKVALEQGRHYHATEHLLTDDDPLLPDLLLLLASYFDAVLCTDSPPEKVAHFDGQSFLSKATTKALTRAAEKFMQRALPVF